LWTSSARRSSSTETVPGAGLHKRASLALDALTSKNWDSSSSRG
jgi:hypothetical protein